jgi:SAM-dependent methyltransferase
MDKEKDFRVLDVGCGRRKRSGAIGIDINPRSDADVIHDLNVFPYPFPHDWFDAIYCDNVLEHVENVIRVMEELHRIAKKEACVTIIEPFFAHRNAYTDPTHKHFFGIHSFDCFLKNTAHSEFRYSTVEFQLRSLQFDKGLDVAHWIDGVVCRFANSHKDVYENRLAHLFPLRTVAYELIVVK